jgi:ATP-dependent protease Clp ATPase subunit
VEGDDLRCTFCGLDRQRAGHLVAGFGAVICDGCVGVCRAAEQTLADSVRVVAVHPAKVGPTARPASIALPSRPFGGACPFCGLPPSDDRRLFVADAASICSDCLTLCEEFLEEQRSGGPV